jgi:hypothetical protein
MEKDINDMTRPEVIQELARYAHPQHYHGLLEWGTEQLRVLLAYYKGEATVEVGFIAKEYNGEDLSDCELLEVSVIKS